MPAKIKMGLSDVEILQMTIERQAEEIRRLKLGIEDRDNDIKELHAEIRSVACENRLLKVDLRDMDYGR